MSDAPLILDGQPLRFEEVQAVARQDRPVAIGEKARSHIADARAVVEQVITGNERQPSIPSAGPVYGINTGFGSLSRVRIAPDQVRQLQRNLIRSHAAGVGEPLPADVVRAMLVILAGSLCRGHSGVRVEVVELIAAMLNAGITPVVPSRGSVGASGDLAPLAHAGLVLIGEGEATVQGKRMTGAEALTAAGLKPITLEAKEGLAIINGTHLMAAIGTLVLCDAERLMHAAIGAAAMAIDACRATDTFLDERLHIARNQPGQQRVAATLRDMLKGSQIVQSHKDGDPRVQDPYCLRAMPQVLGAAIDAIEFVRGVFERELGAVTDNPLVFAPQHTNIAARERPQDESNAILSGGNFHGMPLAIALDTLKIALCHIAGIAERRIFWVLSGGDSHNPVPVYLSPEAGLNSGMMIVQYTAAACCNELQTLAAPASVGNIPTSAGIEDYNSMGATAAHQARAVIDLATHVIAAELLVMAEAIEYQRPLRSGEPVERLHQTIRSAVPRLTEDRPPAPDLAAIAQLIRAGTLGQTC